jgi:hypothetical protein
MSWAPFSIQEGRTRTATAFCSGSDTWFEDTRDLEAILDCRFESTNLPTLSSALLERGLLGTHWDRV